eukprot:SAG31_NODE_242_length_19350_cov_3.043998_9_plen_89_part_00
MAAMLNPDAIKPRFRRARALLGLAQQAIEDTLVAGQGPKFRNSPKYPLKKVQAMRALTELATAVPEDFRLKTRPAQFPQETQRCGCCT